MRTEDVGIHPDIAGFQDLAHAFDLKASLLAARATLEAALERRETRGCHNRSDYPDLDPALQVNLVWSPRTGVVREEIPPVPDEIAALIQTRRSRRQASWSSNRLVECWIFALLSAQEGRKSSTQRWGLGPGNRR